MELTESTKTQSNKLQATVVRTCCLVSDEGQIIGYADWLAENYSGHTPAFVTVGRRAFKRGVQSYNRCAVYQEVKPAFAGRSVSLCNFREAQ